MSGEGHDQLSCPDSHRKGCMDTRYYYITIVSGRPHHSVAGAGGVHQQDGAHRTRVLQDRAAVIGRRMGDTEPAAVGRRPVQGDVQPAHAPPGWPRVPAELDFLPPAQGGPGRQADPRGRVMGAAVRPRRAGRGATNDYQTPRCRSVRRVSGNYGPRESKVPRVISVASEISRELASARVGRGPRWLTKPRRLAGSASGPAWPRTGSMSRSAGAAWPWFTAPTTRGWSAR